MTEVLELTRAMRAPLAYPDIVRTPEGWEGHVGPVLEGVIGVHIHQPRDENGFRVGEMLPGIRLYYEDDLEFVRPGYVDDFGVVF